MSPRGSDAITTIPLRKATRDRLKSLGLKSETYDDLLNRLMDAYQAPARPKSSAAGKSSGPPPALVDFEPIEEGEEDE